MAGGVIKYVPLQPPKDGAIRTSSAADWKLDVDLLEKAFSPKTQMIVRPLPVYYCSLELMLINISLLGSQHAVCCRIKD